MQDQDIRDDDHFRQHVVQGLETLDLDKFANTLGVSRSTVLSWKAGTSAPHPAMRKPVYALLLDQDITEQIEKLAKQAGQRAAARAMGAGAPADGVAATKHERVKARLTERFNETGKLPSIASLMPTIEAIAAGAPPPVINV